MYHGHEIVADYGASEQARKEAHRGELPPETLSPEDHAELAKSADALREAEDKSAGYDEAGECLAGGGL